MSELPFRIGYGFDVHRLEDGRPLVLGGVRIPSDRGPVGHSDADVLLHAIIDALLGAACLGDIGTHFPDTDPKYKGADSRGLLRRVIAMVRDRNFDVVNIDATVIVERPRLAPFFVRMRESVAAELGIETGRVSIKATTAEGIGLVGEGKGIAAHAICLLTSVMEEDVDG